MVRHKSRSNVLKRGGGKIEPRVSLRIYCNGETERIYFEDLSEDLRLHPPIVKIRSTEYNRLSMVKKLWSILKDEGYEPDDHHEVWVVFAPFQLSFRSFAPQGTAEKGQGRNPGL